MGITTYENNVVTEEITKSFSDFSAAATSKSVDIITLDPKSGVLSVEVVVENVMGGLNNNDCLITFGGGGTNLIENFNTSSFSEDVNQNIRNFIDEPFLNTSSLMYTATMQSQGIGIWSLGKSTSYSRDNLAGAGTQTAGVIFNGFDGVNYMNATEEYDGSSWSTSGGSSASKRQLGGCGTQTSALSMGGYNSGGFRIDSEEYNGASWSAGGNLNNARGYLAACGTQTAGLCFGGWTGSYFNVTEEYNGASWTSSGNLLLARYYLSGCGTQTSAMSMSGVWGGSGANQCELYDGAIWTIGSDTISDTANDASTGGQSSAIKWGGNGILYSELYDGLSWKVGSNRSFRTYGLGYFGTSTAAAGACGYTAGKYLTDCDEYDEGTAQNLNGLIAGSLTFKVKYIKYYS